jgi:co-chaperonin GroES (HSP10)
MIPFRLIGPWVLVKPDINSNAPETTDSGVVIAKSLAAAVTGEDPTVSVHRGTVVAVGQPAHPKKPLVDECVKRLPDVSVWNDETGDVISVPTLLKDLVRREPCCAPDDDVLFASDAGQQITMADETYVLLNEDELLAIVE